MSYYRKRWQIRLASCRKPVVVFVPTSLTQIKETVAKFRQAGDASPACGNVRPWLIKHVVVLMSSGAVRYSRASVADFSTKQDKDLCTK